MLIYGHVDETTLTEVIESLAYKVLRYQHPTWYSIPDEEVAQLLREEGIPVYIEGDKLYEQ